MVDCHRTRGSFIMKEYFLREKTGILEGYDPKTETSLMIGKMA